MDASKSQALPYFVFFRGVLSLALSLALLVVFYPLISFTAFHACDNFGFVVVLIISTIFCWIYYIYTIYLSWINLDILYALIHMWHEGYLLQNFTF